MNKKPFVTNCLLVPRPQDKVMFELDVDKDIIHPFLDGYAIIPLEKYLNQSGIGTRNT